MVKLPRWAALTWLVSILGCGAAVGGGDIPRLLSFATPSQGRQILGSSDDFVARLSSFDRSARLKTDQPVSEEEFLKFTAQSVLPWEPSEVDQIQSLYREMHSALLDLKVRLPRVVYIVKTTGLEEGEAAYTRTNAIVFPRQKLRNGIGRELLAHELFHVLSRHDPDLRDKLYRSIGFQHCGEVPFPASLAARKITNPDAPVNQHAIQVRAEGEKLWAMPILFSRSESYDVSKGGRFFDYLEVRFMLVSKEPSLKNFNSLHFPAVPVLFKKDQVSGFFEQIGRNTQYIIHPEEILADNFMILVTGKKDVPSPEVLERMKPVFLGN